MSTEPKKTRARKAPAAKTPATGSPAATTPAASVPAPAAKTAAASSGPQGLLMAGVVIILIALGFIVFLIATGRGAPAPVNNIIEATAAAPQMPNRGRLLPSGLRFEAISEGSGPLIQMTDTALLRYELHAVGRDGVIDGDINAPQPVPLSPASTVRGFAEALTLMRAGGEARFWVPPNLGYGDQGSGPVGPNDILEFHVKVERIAPAGQGAPSADSNTISEEDLQNMIAAMNAAEPAGGH
jgi:peptidylprolyl isomerase